MRIPFNKPYITGNEEVYIREVIGSRLLSGNGIFTKKCHERFLQQTGFSKCLLTTSCTDALEMAAILAGIEPGDEVIVPSYTFVSTANAFVLRGAHIVFADSEASTPNIDAAGIESLITERTRAIVVVHYAGIACDMDPILAIARRHGLLVIEDAAQAIDATYKGSPLGGFGSMAAFSFHETKNIVTGEGGMLVVNDPGLSRRAEIIWEKGTNRSAFYRGEVDKYGWMDIGSSFLPSELIAAFLLAQLEALTEIQQMRLAIWRRYHDRLRPLEDAGFLRLPSLPDYASNNAHMFFVVCNSNHDRNELLTWLKQREIQAVFHYLQLHRSEYFAGKHDGRSLPNCDRYAECLLRLPLFAEMTAEETDYVCEQVGEYYSEVGSRSEDLG